MAPAASPVVIPVTNTREGNAQPLDYLVTDASGDPSKYAQRVYQLLRDTPGAVNVYSSASSLAPQLDVTFDRDAGARPQRQPASRLHAPFAPRSRACAPRSSKARTGSRTSR